MEKDLSKFNHHSGKTYILQTLNLETDIHYEEYLTTPATAVITQLALKMDF